MSTLALVLPVFTTSTPAGTYSGSQLAFVALTSAALWAIFIFVQTVRHRDYFIPVTDAADPDVHAEPPTAREAWVSFGLLLVSLVAVVGLAKMLSPTIEGAVEAANAPRAVVGIVVAGLILLPETWAAVRAARADRLQSSMNLAIGSALACIGLTVPVVVLASIALRWHPVGLQARRRLESDVEIDAPVAVHLQPWFVERRNAWAHFGRVDESPGRLIIDR